VARVVVFHTSDLHGRLSGEAAERIRALKESAPGSLLLDSGDAVSAGNVGVRLFGEPVLRAMGEIGYHAMAMGNREFHPWPLMFRHKLKDLRFPLLCANLRPPRPGPVVSHQVFSLSEGSSAAVFGLCVPMIPDGHWARWISPYRFEDPIETAGRLVQGLRKEAHLVIALTHLGMEQDRMLAELVPGIDLILGGHDHAKAGEPLRIGKCLIARAPAMGAGIGRLELELAGGQVSLAAHETLPLPGEN